MIDIEKLNRDNFKVMMEALSMPGSIKKTSCWHDSNFLALASVLLYSEVSFFYEGNLDFELIQAITNAKKEKLQNADYIFSDEVDLELLKNAKIGTSLEPEFSSTLIFKCEKFDGLKVRVSGAGVDGYKDVTLPVSNDFVEIFNEKNSSFPLGNEVFFINKTGELLALSRTSKIEVI